MAKYAYPAIFSMEDTGVYSVEFPDVPGCVTSGDSLPHAIEMANDALCLMMYDKEEDGEDIPIPSDIRDIQNSTREIVSLISCDTIEYRKFYDNRAVKKTLTIPNWLNTIAEKEGVNFSQLLQSALVEKLGLN